MQKTQVFMHAFTHQKQKTLTVAGLIEVLTSFDLELAVVATWEGVECPITKDSIFKANLQCVATKPTVLYFDVNEHF